ncbi:hypothetical protein JKP88DRAFT_348923 [Tribonema minus]|uniref:Uncharacterized protein n=1 Tax=Tribonema minus TaxID=303371 RepID=A0A836CE03_9STRA|nr:hypothetical protein JKP88DRAFT_348923 [Tribonema minus]
MEASNALFEGQQNGVDGALSSSASGSSSRSLDENVAGANTNNSGNGGGGILGLPRKLLRGYRKRNHKKQAKKLGKQLKRTLAQPVRLRPHRLSELSSLRLAAELDGGASTTPKLALVNVDAAIARAIEACGSEELEVDALVLQCHGKILSKAEKTTIAAAFLASRLVVLAAVGLGANEAQSLARDVTAWSNSVFSVLSTADALTQHISGPLKEQVLLRRIVLADVVERIEPLKKQKTVRHFVTRSAAAQVPLGVTTLNFGGILKLTQRTMDAVGAAPTPATVQEAAKRGGIAGGAQLVANGAGSVYQAAIVGPALADFGTDLATDGLSEALGAMEIVDGFLLGSIFIVRGAVSAAADRVTRPRLVRSLGRYLAALQVAHALHPQLRETPEAAAATAAEYDPFGTIAAAAAAGVAEEDDANNFKLKSDDELPLFDSQRTEQREWGYVSGSGEGAFRGAAHPNPNDGHNSDGGSRVIADERSGRFETADAAGVGGAAYGGGGRAVVGDSTGPSPFWQELPPLPPRPAAGPAVRIF